MILVRVLLESESLESESLESESVDLYSCFFLGHLQSPFESFIYLHFLQ